MHFVKAGKTVLQNLVDTHCHLNDPIFSDRLPEVLERAKEAGVTAFIVPSYDIESLERTAILFGRHPENIFPAYGLHPWFLSENTDFSLLCPYLLKEETVAVGEIGLDFSLECPPAEIQVSALIRQLDMAAESGLPVLIHCRKAFDRLYEILSSYRGRIRGVLHSYSGGKDGMNRFLDLGFYLSFSGSVTRQNARKYSQCAKAIPLDRMLLETDAPSIATQSTVASEVEPRHILEVADKIAEIRNLSISEVCGRSAENARMLFSKMR